jgi:hypothetical protein
VSPFHFITLGATEETEEEYFHFPMAEIIAGLFSVCEFGAITFDMAYFLAKSMILNPSMIKNLDPKSSPSSLTRIPIRNKQEFIFFPFLFPEPDVQIGPGLR